MGTVLILYAVPYDVLLMYNVLVYNGQKEILWIFAVVIDLLLD